MHLATARTVAPRRLAIGIAVPALLLTAIGIPMQLAISGTDPSTIVFIAMFATIVVELAGLGGYVAFRVPENVVGWLLVVAGLLAAISFYGGTYAQFLHLAGQDPGPVGVLGAWFGTWLFGPTLGGLAVFLLLLFPTGRLLSPRWRIAVALAFVGLPLSIAGMALTPGPLGPAPWIENPFGVDSDLVPLATTVGNLLAVPVAIVAMVSFVLRFRRAHDVERQQLKWFGSVAAITITALLISVLQSGAVSDAAWVGTMLSLAALPAAIAIAILRYRLWEIDRIVSRTIAYTVLTVVLGGLFTGLVIGLQAVLPARVENDSLLVAGSTLVTASAFQPLRRAIQVRVDHRFNRARFDGEQATRAFAARVRDDVEISIVVGEAERVIRDALAPRAMSTWLVGGKPAGRALDPARPRSSG